MIVLDANTPDDLLLKEIDPPALLFRQAGEATYTGLSSSLHRSPSPCLDPPPAYPGLPQYAERAGRRFAKAFLVAFLIYTLLGTFVRSLVLLVSHRHRPKYGDWRPIPELPTPEGAFHIDHCAEGDEWTLGRGQTDLKIATTTYALPLLTNDLFFMAKGVPSSGGRVHVKPVVGEENDEVRVDVRLSFASADVIEQAQICRITRGQNGHGVGLFLFSPSHHDLIFSDNILNVDMTIRIPVNPAGPVRPFSIAARSYSITLDDLTSSVHFGKVSIASSGAPIESNGLRAGETLARTTRGPIRGRFAVDGVLNLRTTSAEIAVEVEATNGARDAPPTLVNLVTENAPISANLSLESAVSSKEKGRFQVEAHTIHAPSSLIFLSSPVDSTFRLRSSTSDHPAHVHLHPAYEGSSNLKSPGATPELVYSRTEADPSGRGRERAVEITELTSGELEGRAQWEPFVWWGEREGEGCGGGGDDGQPGEVGTVNMGGRSLPYRYSVSFSCIES